MMNSTLHSPELHEYSSLVWHNSERRPGVRFATRQMSLAQRIALTKQVRDLMLRHDFLKGGDTADQLQATLGDLLSRRLYVEWGLAHIEGLSIDGTNATVELLIEHGPEDLTQEIANAIISDLHLTEEERKNF